MLQVHGGRVSPVARVVESLRSCASFVCYHKVKAQVLLWHGADSADRALATEVAALLLLQETGHGAAPWDIVVADQSDRLFQIPRLFLEIFWLSAQDLQRVTLCAEPPPAQHTQLWELSFKGTHTLKWKQKLLEEHGAALASVGSPPASPDGRRAAMNSASTPQLSRAAAVLRHRDFDSKILLLSVPLHNVHYLWASEDTPQWAFESAVTHIRKKLLKESGAASFSLEEIHEPHEHIGFRAQFRCLFEPVCQDLAEAVELSAAGLRQGLSSGPPPHQPQEGSGLSQEKLPIAPAVARMNDTGCGTLSMLLHEFGDIAPSTNDPIPLELVRSLGVKAKLWRVQDHRVTRVPPEYVGIFASTAQYALHFTLSEPWRGIVSFLFIWYGVDSATQRGNLSPQPIAEAVLRKLGVNVRKGAEVLFVPQGKESPFLLSLIASISNGVVAFVDGKNYPSGSTGTASSVGGMDSDGDDDARVTCRRLLELWRGDILTAGNSIVAIERSLNFVHRFGLHPSRTHIVLGSMRMDPHLDKVTYRAFVRAAAQRQDMQFVNQGELSSLGFATRVPYIVYCDCISPAPAAKGLASLAHIVRRPLSASVDPPSQLQPPQRGGGGGRGGRSPHQTASSPNRDSMDQLLESDLDDDGAQDELWVPGMDDFDDDLEDDDADGGRRGRGRGRQAKRGSAASSVISFGSVPKDDVAVTWVTGRDGDGTFADLLGLKVPAMMRQSDDSPLFGNLKRPPRLFEVCNDRREAGRAFVDEVALAGVFMQEDLLPHNCYILDNGRCTVVLWMGSTATYHCRALAARVARSYVDVIDTNEHRAERATKPQQRAEELDDWASDYSAVVAAQERQRLAEGLTGSLHGSRSGASATGAALIRLLECGAGQEPLAFAGQFRQWTTGAVWPRPKHPIFFHLEDVDDDERRDGDYNEYGDCMRESEDDPEDDGDLQGDVAYSDHGGFQPEEGGAPLSDVHNSDHNDGRNNSNHQPPGAAEAAVSNGTAQAGRSHATPNSPNMEQDRMMSALARAGKTESKRVIGDRATKEDAERLRLRRHEEHRERERIRRERAELRRRREEERQRRLQAEEDMPWIVTVLDTLTCGLCAALCGESSDEDDMLSHLSAGGLSYDTE